MDVRSGRRSPLGSKPSSTSTRRLLDPTTGVIGYLYPMPVLRIPDSIRSNLFSWAKAGEDVSVVLRQLLQAVEEMPTLVGDSNPSQGDGVEADLATLFFDILTGQVYRKAGEGDTDWLRIGTTAYGEIFESNDSGTSYALTSSGFSVWNSGTPGRVLGEPWITTSGSSFIVGSSGSGIYKISAHCSFSGPNGAVFRFAVFVNGDIRNDIRSAARTSGGQSDVEGIAMSGLVQLVPGDTVSLRFSSDGNNTLSVNRANFNLIRV